MAKIIYWKSPIDPTQKTEFKTDKKYLYEVLDELKIGQDPLSVILNGEVPDDISLNLELEKTDVLEIRKIVHGNSSNSKNTWANIISIVALVAVTVLSAGATSPWLIAAIGVAGGVASGALRYRAAKLALRSGQSKSEIDVETNNLSINAANNEARPMQPVPVPMGSTRMAPDYLGQPYPGYSGGVTKDIPLERFVLRARTPIDVNVEFMQTLPAGYLPRGITWPPYDMGIMGDLALSDINALTVDQRTQLAPFFETLFASGVSFGDVSLPVVLYHKTPADPYYGRFTLLANFENQNLSGKTLPQAITEYQAWFDYSYATTTSWYDNWANDYFGSGLKYFWQLPNTTLTDARVLGNLANVPTSNSITNQRQNFPIFINQVINGGYSYPTTTSGFIPFKAAENILEYTVPPARNMIHTLNFGYGDLEITEKAIEKTPLEKIVGHVNDSVRNDSWTFPELLIQFPSRVVSTTVRILEGASLVNNEDFGGPDSIIGPSDQNNYNFVFRSTPKNTFRVEMDFEGQVYASSDSGLVENMTTIEIQYRETGDTIWNRIATEYFISKSTMPMRRTVTFNLSFFSSQEYEFRIRKLEKDENNNNERKIALINIVAVKCFIRGENFIEPADLVGMNAESLFLVANSQTSGQTNKYTAQVDAKCWVYDVATEEWAWELTRNPAWWFLFFARGGFKNLEADGSYVFPWSPTYGWVNGPGHPDSTEILFGCGMSDDKIDIEGLKDWALFCETKNLNIDIVFKEAETEVEVLEKIANIGRGSVSYYKGLLSVVYEDNLQIPVGLYGMGNIIEGSFSADYTVANLPTKVIGTYVDRDEDWETKTVESVVPFSNPDDLNFITLTLDGITTAEQAQREVNILAARQFFQKRNYTWKVDKEGLVAKRGDLVYLAHDSTQFSYSGRILKFNVEDNIIVSCETTAEIKDLDVNFMTVRKPNGSMETYPIRVDNCVIRFLSEFKFGDAPYYLLGNNESYNEISNYPGSYPEDYIFTAGPMSTPGKIVRISQIIPDEQMNFTLTAIDEDPAMWSYEYGPSFEGSSFNDSVLLARVFNVSYKQLGEGRVKLFWEVDGADYIMIRNLDSGLLVNADGMMSFSRGEVILELVKGAKYNLSIEPFAVGSPYKQENKVIVVWA